MREKENGEGEEFDLLHEVMEEYDFSTSLSALGVIDTQKEPKDGQMDAKWHRMIISSYKPSKDQNSVKNMKMNEWQRFIPTR